MLQLSIPRQPSSSRSVGAPASADDRATWPVKKILDLQKTFVRDDFGGAKTDDEKRQSVLRKMEDFAKTHPKANAFAEAFQNPSVDALEFLADVIIDARRYVREGIAKRQKHNADELDRRLNAGELYDKASHIAA